MEQKIKIPEGCQATFKIENGFVIVEINDNRKFVELPDESGKLIKIYEGNEYWAVNKNNFEVDKRVLLDIKDLQKNKNYSAVFIDFYDCFATVQAARNYVEKHKKQFSLNDVENALRCYSFITPEVIDGVTLKLLKANEQQTK
jgi:hypothetical protein